MVNNSTNINKSNNKPSPQIIELKNTTTLEILTQSIFIVFFIFIWLLEMILWSTEVVLINWSLSSLPVIFPVS